MSPAEETAELVIDAVERGDWYHAVVFLADLTRNGGGKQAEKALRRIYEMEPSR